MLVVELTEHIKAPIERIWELVANPHRQHEFVSYRVISTRQINAADLGCEYAWNEQGILLGKRYDCDCRVFGWEPPQWYCFGTPKLFQVSFELEADDQGTKLLYRVELPQTQEQKRDPYDELCNRTIRQIKVLIEGKATSPEA